MITETQRALARLAISALEADPEFAHSLALLKTYFGAAVVDDIKTEDSNARNFNKTASANGAGLSPDAADYWAEVKRVIARGKRGQAKGCRKIEKRVSIAAENCAESFDARVPDSEKGKFIRLDVRTIESFEKTWDDLWSYVEHDPPLLRRELREASLIDHTMNHAQLQVLGSLLHEERSDEEQARTAEASRKLREIARRDR
ncbi:hypothetical protein KCP91_12000 [Microvirga sp. SRT01]|uniref:Uncharacterized protein n=1 Tax=Sphingomonas longa TaxID=2778730 RepID=A0ABS2D842_9SPHN|nr:MULTISPECIES: hypothetical protein [Alphaproteobacteria]MBM6577095.1 hypothetical protein [Sphingomonas sp. BT552]MBR7710139.1 hypothetical protein [Microvirga sp. SRT01]